MKNQIERIEQLQILRSILNKREYNDFKKIVLDNQEEVLKISKAPIKNYTSSLISEEKDRELLEYVYQNIRYYLRQNLVYSKKLEEGIAIFVSKAVVGNYIKPGSIDSYFTLGDYSNQHYICNPFEEVARLLLCTLKDEYANDTTGEDYDDFYIRRAKLHDASLRKVLNLAISKKGIKQDKGCWEHFSISSIEQHLECSNITSDNVISATKEENRDIILEVLSQIETLYHTKLSYQTMAAYIPAPSVSDKLKSRFENKIIYAKRNIGVYEQTKRLVKRTKF